MIEYLTRTAGRVLEPARDVTLSVVGKVVNEVIAQVDLDALLARIDIDALLTRIDMDALMENIDVEAIVGRVDVEAIVGRVDIDGIMARTEMGSLIVRSTSGVAGEALDIVRSGAVGIDGAIGRTVDRVLRRNSNGNGH